MSIDPSKIPTHLLNVCLNRLKGDISTSEFTRYCKLHLEQLNNDHSLLPLESFFRALDLIKVYRKDKKPLSVILLENSSLFTLGSFGMAIMTAPTAQTGLDVLEKYCHEATPISCQIKNFETAIQIYLTGFEIFGQYQDSIEEYSHFLIQRYLQICTQKTEGLKVLIKNSGSEPNFLSHAPCEVECNQARYSTVIEKKQLAAISPLHDLLTHRRLISLFDTYLNTEVSHSAKIESLIQSSIRNREKPTMSVISKVMKISERHLTRLLREEGVSFQQLLDRCIALEAESMLESGLPLKTIAYNLGFNSTNGFTKAFERYHGMTPKEYLEHHQHTSTFIKVPEKLLFTP